MKTMFRTHKIALDLSDKQRTYLAKCAGVSRFAYNWALSEWNRMYDAWQKDKTRDKPNQLLLRRNLNEIKREQFPWMLEVTKCAPQEAIIDLGKAFDRFFKGLSGYPVYKKKYINDSYRISNGFFVIKGKTIGVDAGVDAYVPSSGEPYVTPHSYRKAERRLKRAQQSLSRKKKGSKNYGKQRWKIAKIHSDIFHIRTDFLQKTLIIADRYYPSSKLCSVCGAKAKRLTLGMREWVCELCGALHDREINAAINLKKYADSSAVSVRGEFFASAIPRLCENMASYLCEAETKRQIVS